jgi:hypothetical protein
MPEQNHKWYDWLFRYNSYTKEWYAARREDSHLLFSDIKNKKVLKASGTRGMSGIGEILKKVDNIRD